MPRAICPHCNGTGEIDADQLVEEGYTELLRTARERGLFLQKGDVLRGGDPERWHCWHEDAATFLTIEPRRLYNRKALGQGPRSYRKGRRLYYSLFDIAAEIYRAKIFS